MVPSASGEFLAELEFTKVEFLQVMKDSKAKGIKMDTRDYSTGPQNVNSMQQSKKSKGR